MNFLQWCNDHRDSVDRCLQSRFVDAWPPPFREASLYPLRTGGKRIRPLFAFAAAEALGHTVTEDIVHVGSAVELIHTYSLVHDDLPCMDDDDERRGKPSVHIAFGEPSALLVGDALLTEAFRILTHTDLDPSIQIRLVAELSEAAGHVGMIGGQAADIGLGGPVTDVDSLMRLHNGKTGALIRAANRMGGVSAGAEPDQLDILSRYGAAVGLAFQMADDILDAEEDAGDDGPPSYVKLLGIDETAARARALFQEALDAANLLPQPQALIELARFTIERDN
jgi:geranylgeranyl pyrophosphate synthase